MLSCAYHGQPVNTRYTPGILYTSAYPVHLQSGMFNQQNLKSCHLPSYGASELRGLEKRLLFLSRHKELPFAAARIFVVDGHIRLNPSERVLQREDSRHTYIQISTESNIEPTSAFQNHPRSFHSMTSPEMGSVSTGLRGRSEPLQGACSSYLIGELVGQQTHVNSPSRKVTPFGQHTSMNFNGTFTHRTADERPFAFHLGQRSKWIAMACGIKDLYVP